jgi:adenylate cyclase
MAQEIERKFLVKGEAWRELVPGELFCQGYLSTVKERTVRVRIYNAQATLTIKSITDGISRSEFEYPIPLADAEFMLQHLAEQPVISKYRYRIPIDNVVWEIDEFLGANLGLIIAELELQTSDQPFSLPEWVDKEVSYDPRYYNNNLVKHPYNTW